MRPETTRLDPPDGDLLQRAASGDREAFGLIYRRYQDVVYRFGRSMTGCPTAAEDITQEVFVALFRDLARYDAGRASFTTYLYGIVRNLSRERLRRERRFLSRAGPVSGMSAIRAPRWTKPSLRRRCASRCTRCRRAIAS
jgi:DNA-directed RNA polymerase specialized sigma24 family protein